MLNKRYLKRLFVDNDTNVPVTIFNECTKKDCDSLYRSKWFFTIKDCLGKALTQSEQTYTFQITSIKGKIYTIHCAGNHLIDELRSLFMYKDPMSIRIDILEDYDRSWVIILKNDL